ncbi:MAG: hypothetical protein IPM86_02890 [Saprospiraceae bacterium]|nr:hypothetical protein [Saprospiraceae bacterium]
MITVPMPANGCVTIWAKIWTEFMIIVHQRRLKFSLTEIRSATSKTICCSDFVANGANDELIVDVEMWVEDLEEQYRLLPGDSNHRTRPIRISVMIHKA